MEPSDVNRPLDKIHCPRSGYGRLVAPWLRGRWLAWFRNHGVRLTYWKGFHNCRIHGS